jgi:hypothetical protein
MIPKNFPAVKRAPFNRNAILPRILHQGAKLRADFRPESPPETMRGGVPLFGTVADDKSNAKERLPYS